jgi:hypothetical protein
MMTTCASDLPLAHARQRGKAVHPRQPDVEDDDVEDTPAQAIEAGLAAVDRIDVVSLVAQHAAEGAADARFVVNDQNRWHSKKQTAETLRRGGADLWFSAFFATPRPVASAW